MEKTFRGKVDWLFFHNHHGWRSAIQTMCLDGCCLVPTPCKTICRKNYDHVMSQGRELRHVEKGCRTNRVLGWKKKKKTSEGDKDPDYPFEFNADGVDINKAYMMASTRHPDEKEFTRRIVRSK